jgi:hypothetical protein
MRRRRHFSRHEVLHRSALRGDRKVAKRIRLCIPYFVAARAAGPAAGREAIRF